MALAASGSDTKFDDASCFFSVVVIVSKSREEGRKCTKGGGVKWRYVEHLRATGVFGYFHKINQLGGGEGGSRPFTVSTSLMLI